VNHDHHQETEGMLRVLLEPASEIAAILAPDGTLLQVNSASAAMALVDGSGHVGGRKLFDFIAPQDQGNGRSSHGSDATRRARQI